MNDDDLPDLLASWTAKFNVPLTAFGNLLHVLHPYHPLLPLDPRCALPGKLLPSQWHVVATIITLGSETT